MFNVNRTDATIDFKVILISLILLILSLTAVSASDLNVHKSVVNGKSF